MLLARVVGCEIAYHTGSGSDAVDVFDPCHTLAPEATLLPHQSDL